MPIRPLLTLHRDTPAVDNWLLDQESAPLTHPFPGATRTGAPTPGFNRDHYEVRLGEGEAVFQRARAAVAAWVMFDLGWTRMRRAPCPPRTGELAAVAIRFGVWWINSCRIAHVEDTPARYGFAYGTLPGHVEAGEELFLAERRDDGSVWFSIRAFSRPRHPLTWIGYPLVRILQKRFGRHACARMRREVTGAST